MSPIRILVSELPQLLREIVINVVNSQDDMQIVDDSSPADELSRALERSEADVLVIGCESSDLVQRGDALLSRRPLLKILALDEDGQRSYLYGLRPLMVPLGEVSPRGLVEAIRDAANPRDTQLPS